MSGSKSHIIVSLMRTYTQQYVRSEYHTVFKDEFRRNLRRHRLIAGSGWSLIFFIIYYRSIRSADTLPSRGMEQVGNPIKRNTS